jgi:anti-anti-sigma factor
MARAAQYQGSVSSEVVAGGTRILTLDGEFDVSNSAEFERRLSEASELEPADIVVDVRGVSFADSTMLQVLLRAVTRANRRGTRFALIRPNALVWRAFILTGLSERFLSYSSLHEALANDFEQARRFLLVRNSDGTVLAEFDSEEAVLKVIERGSPASRSLVSVRSA